MAGRAALGLARAVGHASRLWQQHGLGFVYARLQRAPLVGGQRCVVELAPGAFFETETFEPVWAPTVVAERPYEPEMAEVFRRVAKLRPVLVDAGANYGYWSVVATAPTMGFAKAVAIEAAPSTFARLRANADLNPGRIVCVEAAVGATSGETVAFSKEASHVTAMVTLAGRGDYDVQTISIDDAVRGAGLWDHGSFVLKLDVEGFEIPALEGAKELRAAREHLVTFEDFADAGPRGFEHVEKIGAQGYRIYYVAAGRCRRIGSAAHAHEVTSRHRKIGASRNFFAARPGGRFHHLFEAWAG